LRRLVVTVSSWAVALLAVAATSGCFDESVVEGLPCLDAKGCGDEHECVLGICRAPGYDPTSTCGDGRVDVGENCYGRRHVDFDEVGLVLPTDLDDDGIGDFVTTSSGPPASATMQLLVADGAGAHATQTLALQIDAAVLVQTIDPQGDLPATARTYLDNLGDVAVVPLQFTAGHFGGDSGQADLVVRISPPMALDDGPNLNNLAPRLPHNWLWIAYDVHEGTNSLERIDASRSVADAGVALGAITPRQNGLLVGNFDADPALEIAVLGANMGGSAPAWWIPDVAATGVDPQPLLAGGLFANVHVVDVDGDGVDEIVGRNDDDGAVLSEGLLDPMALPTAFKLPADVGDMEPVDIDGDGRVELLVARENTNAFQIMSLGGDLSFGAPLDFDGIAATEIQGADFDGDGNFDVVLAAATSLTIVFGGPEQTFVGNAELLAGAWDNLRLDHYDADDVIDIAAAAVVAGGGATPSIDFADP
jgi:hypothetical protein